MDLRVFVIVVILFSCAFAVQLSNHGSESRFKRRLRWNANKYIVASAVYRLRIEYLQPHPKSVEVLDNRNYLAFTLYVRNDRWEALNTGVFHFIDSDTAIKHSDMCSLKTPHAGAYHYFYENCPESDINVVASGYCYQGRNGNGLVFRSDTFNSGAKPYVDKKYYQDETRQMHEYEESLTRACFESWKADGFKVSSWRCPTNGIPLSAGLTSDEKERRKRSSDGCNDCECTAVNGSPRPHHVSILLLGISLTFLIMATGQDLVFTM